MGLTFRVYQKMHRGATMEEFKSLTPERVLGIARRLYRSYGAHKITNDGVAIMVADNYWGGVSNDLLHDALRRAGQRSVGSVANGLSKDAIAEINAADPRRMIDAFYHARLDYHRRDIAKNPEQAKAWAGWWKRDTERWIQAKLTAGYADDVALWLNGRQLSELRPQLRVLSHAQRSELHDVALQTPGLGPDSRIALETAASYEKTKGAEAQE
jgi:hypothetical protein